MQDFPNDERIYGENVDEYSVSASPFRVYVACSLTNERSPSLRDRLLSEIRRIFRKYEFFVYDPSEHTKPGSPHHANEVATIDYLESMCCDLIFFVRDNPSHGMGIEAQIAADMLIPWGDAKIDTDLGKLCPLIQGLTNWTPNQHIEIYFDKSTIDDKKKFKKEFSDKLEDNLKNPRLTKMLRERKRDISFASRIVRKMEFGRTMRRQRLLLNMSASELGELIDLEPWWVIALETNESLADSLTILQIVRIALATRLKFTSNDPLPEGLVFPQLSPVDDFSGSLIAAADEFAEYSLRRERYSGPSSESDDEMLQHWREWLNTSKSLAVPQRPPQPVVPTSKLSVFVAQPLSRVDEQGKKMHELLVHAIQDACGKSSALPIQLLLPDIKGIQRGDFSTEIYLNTLTRLLRSDFSIALLTPPATGVGIMGLLFANSTMPCVLIAEKGAIISRMLLGIHTRRIGDVIAYSSPEEVLPQFANLLNAHLPRLCESAARRRTALKLIIEAEKECKLNRFVRSNFDGAERHFPQVPFVRGEWLDGLARNQGMLATVTLIQFVHIANKLDWRIGATPSGVPFYLQLSHLEDVHEGVIAFRQDPQERKIAINAHSVENTKQRMLPGLEASDEIVTAVIFLLSIAEKGLSPCIVSRAVGESRENLDTALAAKFKSGKLVTEDGLWRKNCDFRESPPVNGGQILLRALDALLIFLHCENDTLFAARISQNIKLLAQAAEPIPAEIQARLNVFLKKRSKVEKHVREKIRHITDNRSREHAELMVLMGCCNNASGEDTAYLDGVIEVCENNIQKNEGADSGWKELLARACVARVRLASPGSNDGVAENLLRATDLLASTGHVLAASAVKFRFFHFKEIGLRQHFKRSSSESPFVRVEAVRLCKATPLPSGALSRRQQVSEAEWDSYIAQAKANEPWNG
jgi:hypothetical protein